MANTFVKIASVSLSSSAATIDFSSIPSTYTDLIVKWSVRLSDAGTNSVELTARFNGDTGNNYTRRTVAGDGGTAFSNTATTSYMRIGWASVNGNTANTFGQGEFYIPNYASSTTKSVSADGVAESNAAQFIYAGLHAGLWTGTAAITSITLLSSGLSLLANSTATLYGIKNS